MLPRHNRIVNRVISRLKLRQLRLLVTVAQYGSIQHAARELQVSQPAATKLIQDLEQDFEVTLFERRPASFSDKSSLKGFSAAAQIPRMCSRA